MPKIRAETGEGMKRKPQEFSTEIVNPITGPPGRSMPQERNVFREQLKASKQKFLAEGAKRGPGTWTASETGARGLAVRHFEEFVREVKKAAARNRARTMT